MPYTADNQLGGGNVPVIMQIFIFGVGSDIILKIDEESITKFNKRESGIVGEPQPS